MPMELENGGYPVPTLEELKARLIVLEGHITDYQSRYQNEDFPEEKRRGFADLISRWKEEKISIENKVAVLSEEK